MEETGSAEYFTEMGTIGIEEEYFIVDDRGRPVSGTDKLVYESEPPEILQDRLDHELFKFVIETQTPIIKSIDQVADTVHEIRAALLAYAREHGFQIASAGLHPAAKWRELEHAEKPRYRSQLDRIQYPQHRNTTAGLHIHIGIDDADKAVWIANEIRWYLPVILALSVNSPYWDGYDTGLESARAKIFENLPNTGMPTAFSDFNEYLAFEELMLSTNSIKDRGELWFDVRPHSTHGTVEVRTPDAQADPERVILFVEYVERLVRDLADRFEDGESGTDFRRELLDENKWRAIRHGRNASFIKPHGDGIIALPEIVEHECDRLGFPGIETLYRAESGAEHQRRLLQNGGMDALCNGLLLPH